MSRPRVFGCRGGILIRRTEQWGLWANIPQLAYRGTKLDKSCQVLLIGLCSVKVMTVPNKAVVKVQSGGIKLPTSKKKSSYKVKPERHIQTSQSEKKTDMVYDGQGVCWPVCLITSSTYMYF